MTQQTKRTKTKMNKGPSEEAATETKHSETKHSEAENGDGDCPVSTRANYLAITDFFVITAVRAEDVE